ncbi:unnamed protein product, partial [marine sediment metagenome]
MDMEYTRGTGAKVHYSRPKHIFTLTNKALYANLRANSGL